MENVLALNLGTIQVWVAFVLTLMVFSYLLGDNPLFRIAEHLLVGTTAGYAVVVAYHFVIKPRLVLPLIEQPLERAYLLAPLLLGLLLLTKGRKGSGWAGNTSMGILFGVGAALAIGGAAVGTLVPQIQATLLSLDPTDFAERDLKNLASALLVVIGTTGTLLYFYYSEPSGGRLSRLWGGLRKAWGRVGYWFILVTLGALFANTALAWLALLVGRIRFLLDTLGLLGS